MERATKDDREADRPQPTDELFTQLYTELRRLALARIRAEPTGHTLSPTDLVHETYLRLNGDPEWQWQNRRHFFAAAAKAMRRVLVDWARGKARAKRGGDRRRITLAEHIPAAGVSADEILEVDRALERLRHHDATMAEVVVLRYFGGLTVDEAAEVLGLSSRTVYRAWRAARTWMYNEM